MAGTPTRQLLSRQERHDQILAAAARAFARGGFAATSMAEVATEAGITKVIVYRHFASKEELYRSVLEQVSGELSASFQRELRHPDGDRPGFIPRSMLEVARREPDAVRLLMMHANREPAFADYARERFDDAVALADGLIAGAITDPLVRRWAGRTIVSYLTSSLLVWLDEGDPDRDEEFVELAAEGLKAMFLAWVPESERARVLDEAVSAG